MNFKDYLRRFYCIFHCLPEKIFLNLKDIFVTFFLLFYLQGMKQINYKEIAASQTRIPTATAKKDHLSGAVLDITVNISTDQKS